MQHIVEFESFLEESNKGFWRLPRVAMNELYAAEQTLTSLLQSQSNGNDLNMDELNRIIGLLQTVKKQAKKFRDQSQIVGTSYAPANTNFRAPVTG
jgi:hypothetical protein